MSEDNLPTTSRRRGSWTALAVAAALGWFGNECWHCAWDVNQAAANTIKNLETLARWGVGEVSRRYGEFSVSSAAERVKACVGGADSCASAGVLPAAAQDAMRKGDEALAEALALMAEADKMPSPALRQQRWQEAEKKLEVARQHLARAVSLAPSNAEVVRKSQEAARLFYDCRKNLVSR